MTDRSRLRRNDAPAAIPPALFSRAVQARQLRATMSTFLPPDLFVDPAWDMMIELFIATGSGERLFVKDLILLSGESAASAIRRIDRLQAAGLLVRKPAPEDHRRVQVGLTDRGRTAMTAMLEHLFDLPTGEAVPHPAPRSFEPGNGWG